MADGLGYTPGSGATVATDEIGGQQYQRIKLVHGNDGVNAGDASTTNPYPVSLPTAQIDRIGAVDEAAAANDSATSGLNGLLKRLLARITSLLDRLPSSLASGKLDIRTLGANTDGVTEMNSGAIKTAVEKIDDLVLKEDDPHVSADPGVQLLAVRTATPANRSNTDGDYEPLQISAGRLWVSVDLATGAATEATLAAIAAKLAPLASNKLDIRPLASGTDGVTATGTVAHDAVDSGNPVKIGHRAVSSIHSATLVSDGDRSDAVAGLDGVPIVRPHATLDSLVSGTASNTDGAATAVLAAAGAGIKIYLTDITIANTSATNIYVEIKDGTTTKWVLPVPANGGVTHRFGSPLGGTANTAWNFDPSAAASTVYCSASGFRSKI